MKIIPQYKIGTSIAVNKQKALDYFYKFIDHKNEESETYICIDNSILILQPSKQEGEIFVKFHCNIQVNTQDKSISFPGVSWFLDFCKEIGCEIQSLNTKVIIPSSGGAIMSDLFSSEAYRIARHYANHPKDKPYL